MEKRRATIIATCAMIILLLAFTGVAVHLSMVSDNKAKNAPPKNNPSENDHGGSSSGGKPESPQSNDNSGNQQTLVAVGPEPPKPPCKCSFKGEHQQSHFNPFDPNVFSTKDVSNEQVDATLTSSHSREDNSSTGFNELHARKRQDIS